MQRLILGLDASDKISSKTSGNGIFSKAEIIVSISKYLELKELNCFAMVDSSLLKLLFNLEKSTLSGKKEFKKDYEKDESKEFSLVQSQIWKPLLVYHFPKFEQSLNIKNWMHVLRRRRKHIKLHKNSTNFSIEKPSFASSQQDEKIIEQCEWIYKCPLSFDSLESSGDDTEKFCKVCNKSVYLVDNMEDFKLHLTGGRCIAFTNQPFMDHSFIMGSVCYKPSIKRESELYQFE